MNKNWIEKIENYLKAYNSFDINGMLKDLHKDVVFENISNGEINLSSKGIQEFKALAEQAKDMFAERQQQITHQEMKGYEVVVGIHYRGVLAKDLPNGMSAGETIELNGKSEFTFKNDLIIKIKDIS